MTILDGPLPEKRQWKTVKHKGQGHQVKKSHFESYLTILQEIFEVKGHMGQGQKSTLKIKVTRSKMWF